MPRLRFSTFLNAVILIWGWAFSAPPAFSQSFSDTGFFAETIVSLPSFQPVGMTWAPDGRMFIWQENGTVRIFKNGALLPTPFLDIGDHVNTASDRGLLGLALDPDFKNNGYVYLYYAYEPNAQPSDGGPKTARLTRVQSDWVNADRVRAGSETVLLGSLGVAPCSQYPAGSDCIGVDVDAHMGGTIRFAPDGRLFVSIGDGASYKDPDTLSFRSQDLNRYEGKILRINSDGSAPGDNPFDDGTQSIRSKVYSYGLRNPFRFGLDPMGEPYIGDVGTNRFEEVNRGRGANFGWPCMEGDEPNWYRIKYPGYEKCDTMDTNLITKPVYTYGRDDGRCVIGGSFNTGNRYPSSMSGDYFFADYATNKIMRMKLDQQGQAASVQPFVLNLEGPVSLEWGPDGYLYYINFTSQGSAEIRRIGYSKVPPIAKLSASSLWGKAPLGVTFSSAGSVDSGGSALTYQWDFGDGSKSTEANPYHIYTSVGVRIYPVVLTVTNKQGRTAQVKTTITLGSSPPVSAILKPQPGAIFHQGDTIFFEASASDSDQILSDSAFSWQLLVQHDEHLHPQKTVSGPRGFIEVIGHGDGEFRYVLQLTVTDNVGLKSTRTVVTGLILPPRKPNSCSDADTALNQLIAALPTESDGMMVFGNLTGNMGVEQALIGRDFIPFLRNVFKVDGSLLGYFITSLKSKFTSDVAGMTLVDVDGDGDNDLTLGLKDGRVQVSIYSDCYFSTPHPVLQGPPTAVYPVVADLNGDGTKDVLLNAGSLGLFAYRNLGTPLTPVFGEGIKISLLGGASFDGPVICEDFDSDGVFDFAGISGGSLWKYSRTPGAGQPFIGIGSNPVVAGVIPGCHGCFEYLTNPVSGIPGLAGWRE